MSKNKGYWLNAESRDFLSQGYLEKGQTAEERIKEIATTAEKTLIKGSDKFLGFAEKFEDYLLRGWYSLSSPVWSNFGNTKGLPISCNGSALGDSMESILYKSCVEIGIMTKNGAGTSAYLGNLRARGTPISRGGKASGPVHYARLIDACTDVVSQSNVRRGSCAVYLPVEHPDIMEFLRMKSEGHPIQNLSFGVTISDKFMESVKKPLKESDADDRKNKEIFARIIEVRYSTGYPYIIFSDTVNNNAPKAYKDKGKKILASNLCCVTGDQRVVTDKGLLTAKELFDSQTQFKVFDGNKAVKASKMEIVKKNAEVFKVSLRNGFTHNITPCHKVLTIDGIKECRDLKVGDRVAFQKNPGLFGDKDMPKEAFLLGMYHGDGTQDSERIMIDLWENDFDLIDEISDCVKHVCEKYDTQKVNNRTHPFPKFLECSLTNGTVRKKRLASVGLRKALNFQKGVIPNWIWEGNENTQWQYIRGLFYTDGTVNICNTADGNPLHLSLSSIDKDFLKNIQIILINLGITSTLNLLRDAGKTLLPDGKGGKKLYDIKECWRIVCGNKKCALLFEKKTGFLTRKGKFVEDREYRDNTKKFSRITAIEKIQNEDVYCCEVFTSEHLWTVNGIITHNSEIALSSSEDESFVCNLSSMNILHYEEWKDTDAVELLTYFLDAVMEEYIEKTKDIKEMAAAYNFAVNQRALGIGTLGWHSFLQSKMIPFESFEAKGYNVEIHRCIFEKSQTASKFLAEFLGEPELLKGYGKRNITTCAVAPTTSSSFILGQVSPSVEPLCDNYFVKNLAKGAYTYKNPYLASVLESHGKNDQGTWNSVLKRGGSVQHLEFLTQNEKDVFKTFGEISQLEIVTQAAQRQKWIDQSQSINLMVPSQEPASNVAKLIVTAWELGVKTLYYQRSANPAQQLSRSMFACKSCEG